MFNVMQSISHWNTQWNTGNVESVMMREEDRDQGDRVSTLIKQTFHKQLNINGPVAVALCSNEANEWAGHFVLPHSTGPHCLLMK